jgi:hypothetical protein
LAAVRKAVVDMLLLEPASHHMQACRAAAAAVGSDGCLSQPARASHVVPADDLPTQNSHLDAGLQTTPNTQKTQNSKVPCVSALQVNLSLQRHVTPSNYNAHQPSHMSLLLLKLLLLLLLGCWTAEPCTQSAAEAESSHGWGTSDQEATAEAHRCAEHQFSAVV